MRTFAYEGSRPRRCAGGGRRPGDDADRRRHRAAELAQGGDRRAAAAAGHLPPPAHRRDGGGRGPADRGAGADERRGRAPWRGAALSGARRVVAARGVGAAAQHGDDGRQPRPAHPLPVLHRVAVQPAPPGQWLRGPGRRQQRARRPRWTPRSQTLVRCRATRTRWSSHAVPPCVWCRWREGCGNERDRTAAAAARRAGEADRHGALFGRPGRHRASIGSVACHAGHRDRPGRADRRAGHRRGARRARHRGCAHRRGHAPAGPGGMAARYDHAADAGRRRSG